MAAVGIGAECAAKHAHHDRRGDALADDVGNTDDQRFFADLQKAALGASAFLLLFLSYGHVLHTANQVVGANPAIPL